MAKEEDEESYTGEGAVEWLYKFLQSIPNSGTRSDEITTIISYYAV